MIGLVNSVQVFLMVLAIFVLIGIFIVLAVFIKQRREDAKDIAEDDDSNEGVEYAKMLDLLPIDDVSDNMIIMNGGKDFVAIIGCKGQDFYKLDAMDQLGVQNNYINFHLTHKAPYSYHQAAKDADMTPVINRYNDALTKKEELLFELSEDYKDLERELKGFKEEERSAGRDNEFHRLLDQRKKLQHRIQAVEWQVVHLKSQIQRIYDTSGAMGAKDPIRVYVYSWSPRSLVDDAGLSQEQIHKKAVENLGKLAQNKISQLASAGVSAWRYTDSELIDLCRIHMMPYSGNRYPVRVLNEITSDDYFYTTKTVSDMREHVYEEAAEDLLMREMGYGN